MLPYRIFVKDCLDLTGQAIANMRCSSFNVSRDLLTSATSSFEVLEIPSNIKEGDVLGLVDPYGTILYEGIIEAFDDTSINCTQMISIFNDNWLWRNPSGKISKKIQTIIQEDFINSSDSLIATKFPFTVTDNANYGGKFEVPEQTPYVVNFMEFLNELYNTWGVFLDFYVPFQPGTPTITIKKLDKTQAYMKVGNNMVMIRNMTPFTEIFETNKLVIYNKEGTTLRATYYGTAGGITQNMDDPLRLPVLKTSFVFDTDTALEDIVDDHLQEEMLNHKITFDLILDNKLYDFTQWQLGQPIDIWYNEKYFSTIFTGYSLVAGEDQPLHTANVVCGKVRNKLTEILNGRK